MNHHWPRYIPVILLTTIIEVEGVACDNLQRKQGIMKTTAPERVKKTVQRQQRTQQQLEQALDHMIDGCQIISPDFRYIYVNRTVAKQGHNTKDRLLGRTMMEVYPGIEQTEMFKRLRRCMQHRTLQRMENEFTYPDGNKAWFELKMEPVPEGVLIFSEDISFRKKAEQALLATMEELKKAKDEMNLEKITDLAILESIGDGLVAINAKARIMIVNKTAERLLGRKATELVGNPVTELLMLDEDGNRISATKRPIYSVLHNGATIGPSFTGNYFVHKDKGKFPVGLTATPIKLEGKIIGAIEVFRDISKEQEIDKAKTEFVSIASHQLRTPLGIAKWYLEAAQTEGYLDRLPKVGREYLEEVNKSNERVLNVVRELLSVSRIDQGRIKNDPKQTDVVQLLRDIVSETGPVAASKNITLRLKVKQGRYQSIYIDQLRLHEVIQNLIFNALEYTSSGGSVVVTIERKARELVIRVVDTGIGISEKDQKRLFTKFFRSETAALKNPDGSGLGLYVVKSYVEDWGGKVTVRSQEGKGTTLSISLPPKMRKAK